MEGALEELICKTRSNFEHLSSGVGLIHTVNETLHLDVHKISQGLKGSEDRIRGAISELNGLQEDMEGSLQSLAQTVQELSKQVIEIKNAMSENEKDEIDQEEKKTNLRIQRRRSLKKIKRMK